MAKKLYNTIEEDEAVNDSAFTEAPAKEPVNDTKVEAVTDEAKMSSFVKTILKAYSDCDFLFIDKQGGVFGKTAKLQTRGSAIYYKNPYFKK